MVMDAFTIFRDQRRERNSTAQSKECHGCRPPQSSPCPTYGRKNILAGASAPMSPFIFSACLAEARHGRTVTSPCCRTASAFCRPAHRECVWQQQDWNRAFVWRAGEGHL